MTEPQVWAVIGTFATALFGMLGFVLTSLQRTIKTEIHSVRIELGAKIDHLDRDVQFLMKRVRDDLT